MTVSLTATPLPDDAAVRLRLDASTDANPVVLDYSTAGYAANVAYASEWISSGSGIAATGASEWVYVVDDLHNGTTFVTRQVSGLTVGQHYSVTVWIDSAGGQVILGRGTTEVRTTHGIYSGAPAAGSGPSALTYEFTASSVTEDVRLTLRSTSTFSVGMRVTAFALRPVPSQRLAFYQTLSASDAPNWSQITTVPADATATITAAQTILTVGGSQYRVLASYVLTGGNPVQFPAGQFGIKRTVTGLTVGRKYRVNMRVRAESRYIDASTSAATTSRLQVAAGVAGKGVGTPTTAAWSTYEFTATATSHVVEARVMSFSEIYATPAGENEMQIIEDVLYVEDLYAELAAPYSLKSLTRSDDNGTRPVRLYEGQGLSDGVLVTLDPEPALTGLVAYTAVVHDAVTNKDVTVNASATLAGQVTRSRIAPASLPSAGAWFEHTLGISIDRQTTSTVAQVINRPDPLVTLGAQTLRAGVLTIWAEDYVTGSALESVFNRGEVVLLRQPDYPGLDMYVVGTRTSLSPVVRVGQPARWELSLDYTEVAAPTTPLRGSIGWTFGESAARNATFAASRTEFPTFLDLLIGPEA
jgi:hypothetical protein